MYRAAASAFLLFFSSIAPAAQQGAPVIQLTPQTTLPIAFTTTISARRAHKGEIVSARTIQDIHLANGAIIPSGARVLGHVTDAKPFVYDRGPYQLQKESTLTIHFDTLQTNGASFPLNVTVRALADYFATDAAREPRSTDLDSLSSLTLVGGDILTPSRTEIRDRNNDVVAYHRRDGVYAHLIANGRCDGSTREVSMGIYSASACGLYGYTNAFASEFGSAANPSTLTLVSRRTSPEIVKQSTALLEVLPQEQTSVER